MVDARTDPSSRGALLDNRVGAQQMETVNNDPAQTSQTPVAQSGDSVFHDPLYFAEDRNADRRATIADGPNRAESEVSNDSDDYSRRSGADDYRNNAPAGSGDKLAGDSIGAFDGADGDEMHHRGDGKDQSGCGDSIVPTETEVAGEIDYSTVPPDVIDWLPHGGKKGKPGKQIRKRWKRRTVDGQFIRGGKDNRILLRTKTFKWVSYQTWNALKPYCKKPEALCEQIEKWEASREGKRDN